MWSVDTAGWHWSDQRCGGLFLPWGSGWGGARWGWWFHFTLQFLTCHWHYLDVFLLATLNPRQFSRGHARVTAAWTFSRSWMILVESIHMYRVHYSLLYCIGLDCGAAHRFHLDTLPPLQRPGQAMEFSPVGSGNRACRGRSAGDNSAERLDSRSLSLAWPSMPFCNHCAMLPHWFFSDVQFMVLSHPTVHKNASDPCWGLEGAKEISWTGT